MSSTVHVIGAGLAGLAAALKVDPTRHRVIVHEAARHAGGRCWSYHDAMLGQVIDNGNHLVLSGNAAVRDFVRTIGAEDKLSGPREAAFDFANLATGARWRITPSAGPVPWWIFSRRRRVPGTRWHEYLALGKLLLAGRKDRVDQVMACRGALYEKLWHPLLVAALNTDPRCSSAALAAAVVRESLAKGGAACRPLVATEGLSKTFIEPALVTLKARGVEVRFDHRLRSLQMGATDVSHLVFADGVPVQLASDDRVILAAPGPVAASLVPGLIAPVEYRAIVNAHFLAEAPSGHPLMVGLVNGASEWLFSFPGRLSVTISNADRYLDMPKAELASVLWREVATVTGHDPGALPPHRIILEKRATFAALPEQDARRPGTRTAWGNLFLAGDWTRTGLPATIEGALRSGYKAASLAAQ